MRFLCGRLVDPNTVRCPHVEKIVEFKRYMAEERGLAATTIVTRDWYLKRFFIKLGFGTYALDSRFADARYRCVANARRARLDAGWSSTNSHPLLGDPYVCGVQRLVWIQSCRCSSGTTETV